MRGRAIIPLVVELGVGVFAIKMFVNVLQNAKGSSTGDMVEVVSAVADIAPTMEITEAMIGMRQVPKSLAPKMAFAKKEEVVGRVASMVIPNGSAVTTNLLAPKGTPAGLAVRILGRVTKERVRILQEADAIFLEELRASGWYEKTAQAFAVLLPVKSVGGMGDEGTYEHVCALRAVTTDDFMTADFARIPHDLLGAISNRIVNEVRGINRVVYDTTTKPPATIEWE